MIGGALENFIKVHCSTAWMVPKNLIESLLKTKMDLLEYTLANILLVWIDEPHKPVVDSTIMKP